MADFALATPSEKQEWSDTVTTEYVRESGLKPYMSSKGDGIINVVTDLQDAKGTIVHCPYYAKLRGAGNDGSSPLAGNEDTLANYSMAVKTKQVRNAINISLNQSIKTEVDVLGIAKTSLKNWLAERLRGDLIDAFQSIPVAGSGGLNPEDTAVTFSAASTAQKNAFMVTNADRVLCGSLNSNYNATMSTALANIRGTEDRISASLIQLAVRKAGATTNSSTFAIEPYKTADGQEWYVLFVDSNGYRDAFNDPKIQAFNQHARPRETGFERNPLYTAGDLVYGGVIIKQIRELPLIAGAGASGINVGHAVLAGRQAVNLAYNFLAQPTTKTEDDYQNVKGAGVREFRGQQKASIMGLQTGMVSVFHSSVADA